MTVVYEVFFVHLDRTEWERSVCEALDARLHALGVDRTIEVRYPADVPSGEEPSIGLYFGSETAAGSPEIRASIARAHDADILVVPIVERLSGFTDQTPSSLRSVNGCAWGELADPADEIARLILEHFEIEESRRRVFISYKRDEALIVADQLHDRLNRRGFSSFIDRIHIRPGDDVLNRITEVLEEFAFLLLLETPAAYQSEGVLEEVSYALGHYMGMHIVTWPNVSTLVGGSQRLPRQKLTSEHFLEDGVLTDEALEEVVMNVEEGHAHALARRRRSLLLSASEAARIAGREVVEQPGNRLLVTDADRSWLVGVTPRLPRVEDLFELYEARETTASSTSVVVQEGVLVHPTRVLPGRRQALLNWSVELRPLSLVRDIEIGGYW